MPHPDPAAGEPAPEAAPTYEDLAGMFDHSLLKAELSEEDVINGCKLARAYQVASVCVRPCNVELAVSLMKDSGVAVGSVVGFPHGANTTPVKLYEARDLLRRGAREIDAVLNIGKMIARQFHYVENELLQLSEACHAEGAILKVIFENAYLTEDLKLIGCKLAKRTSCDFVKTSTGFAPTGATLDDLRLMARHALPRVQVKAAGGIRTLEAALEVREIGVTRIGATATATILDAWKQRLAEQAEQQTAEKA